MFASLTIDTSCSENRFTGSQKRSQSADKCQIIHPWRKEQLQTTGSLPLDPIAATSIGGKYYLSFEEKPNAY